MDQVGRLELHYAAQRGDLDAVAARLQAGDAVSLPDLQGWTPLHFAAQGQHPHVVQHLLEAGALVDALDGYGNTPLSRAVFESRGQGDTIARLLAAGADPDRANSSGVSPRELALRIANYDVARFMPPRP